MNLEECYNAFGGSYQDMKHRLPQDAIIQRFLIKFLSDESYGMLDDALREENYEMAFKAVHTLKGVSLNLCCKKLSESSSRLTEVLRNFDIEKDVEVCDVLWKQVTLDYNEVVEAIRKLAKEV